MATELSLPNLLPAISNKEVVLDKLRSSTFIGIDFGTSTTVVSYTVIGDNATPIKTDVIPIRQLNLDGSYTENHLVPSCIAWYDNKLLIGQTAKQLKSKLTYGRNIWYSFKMKLGIDSGPTYYSSELNSGHPQATIERPLDAAKVFFKYLKAEIYHFVQSNNLPSTSYYSVSIPASFEANQRKDLREVLDQAGISFQESLFIDEPNAAFLSYLIAANSNNVGNYNIPVDSPLHILVFDFGAGTCDISILEIGRKSGRLYSKNIAISKFEQLGGDDIDRRIVQEVLLPQLLAQNGLEQHDIRRPEYTKIIIPKLQPIAEHLKIQICKRVLQNMVGQSLPSLATSEQKIKVEQEFSIILPQHHIVFKDPTLSYSEFNKIIKKYIDIDSKFDSNNENEGLRSIFTVIKSALQKGEIEKDLIDLVLLIGGSSYNPYIQDALRKYFTESELEIPGDLQSHVSNGTAINSFLVNGLNIDLIKPIVSEPILIILEDEVSRIIIREGTEIPTSIIEIDNLHPREDYQKMIEIPICVSSKEKILTVIKIPSDKGFLKTDKIRLECHVSHDKLIHFKAFVGVLEIGVQPLNPFSNEALTADELAEKQLLKSLNEIAKKNGGQLPLIQLKELANFYVKIENHLKAAETFEAIQLMDPNGRYEGSICYHFASGGHKKQSDKWAEKAYNAYENGSNAYNLALVKEEQGDMAKYVELMEHAVRLNSTAAMLTYGEYLLTRDKTRAKELIQNAFDAWYVDFQSNTLHKNNYSRLIRAARQLGRLEVEQKVKTAYDKIKGQVKNKWYSEGNLVTDNTNSLPEIID